MDFETTPWRPRNCYKRWWKNWRVDCSLCAVVAAVVKSATFVNLTWLAEMSFVFILFSNRKKAFGHDSFSRMLKWRHFWFTTLLLRYMEVKGYTWPVAEANKKRRSPVMQSSRLLGSTTNHQVSREKKKPGCLKHNLWLYIYILPSYVGIMINHDRIPGSPPKQNGIMESNAGFLFVAQVSRRIPTVAVRIPSKRLVGSKLSSTVAWIYTPNLKAYTNLIADFHESFATKWKFPWIIS